MASALPTPSPQPPPTLRQECTPHSTGGGTQRSQAMCPPPQSWKWQSQASLDPRGPRSSRPPGSTAAAPGRGESRGRPRSGRAARLSRDGSPAACPSWRPRALCLVRVGCPPSGSRSPPRGLLGARSTARGPGSQQSLPFTVVLREAAPPPPPWPTALRGPGSAREAAWLTCVGARPWPLPADFGQVPAPSEPQFPPLRLWHQPAGSIRQAAKGVLGCSQHNPPQAQPCGPRTVHSPRRARPSGCLCPPIPGPAAGCPARCPGSSSPQPGAPACTRPPPGVLLLKEAPKTGPPLPAPIGPRPCFSGTG